MQSRQDIPTLYSTEGMVTEVSLASPYLASNESQASAQGNANLEATAYISGLQTPCQPGDWVLCTATKVANQEPVIAQVVSIRLSNVGRHDLPVASPSGGPQTQVKLTVQSGRLGLGTIRIEGLDHSTFQLLLDNKNREEESLCASASSPTTSHAVPMIPEPLFKSESLETSSPLSSAPTIFEPNELDTPVITEPSEAKPSPEPLLAATSPPSLEPIPTNADVMSVLEGLPPELVSENLASLMAPLGESCNPVNLTALEPNIVPTLSPEPPSVMSPLQGGGDWNFHFDLDPNDVRPEQGSVGIDTAEQDASPPTITPEEPPALNQLSSETSPPEHIESEAIANHTESRPEPVTETIHVQPDAGVSFHPGDSVSHTQYGVGKIQNVIPVDDSVVLSVVFEAVGKRLLDPKYTQLTKV